jgi:hypothetical protein
MVRDLAMDLEMGLGSREAALDRAMGPADREADMAVEDLGMVQVGPAEVQDRATDRAG